MNNRGVNLISVMVGSLVGVIVLAGLARIFENVLLQVNRVEARMELVNYTQEIQSRAMNTVSCDQMLQVGQRMNLTAMAEVFNSSTTQVNVGHPINLTMVSGETLATNSDFNNGKLHVDRLALTNRRVMPFNGPNGFPVHQATLLGVFSYKILGFDRTLAARPITTLALEINPATNSLSSCFVGFIASGEQLRSQCLSIGGSWSRSGNSCDFTAPRPPPVNIPSRIAYGPPTASKPCGNFSHKFGYEPAASIKVRKGPFASGFVQWVTEDYEDGSSGYVHYHFSQCQNGRWTNLVRFK